MEFTNTAIRTQFIQTLRIRDNNNEDYKNQTKNQAEESHFGFLNLARKTLSRVAQRYSCRRVKHQSNALLRGNTVLDKSTKRTLYLHSNQCYLHSKSLSEIASEQAMTETKLNNSKKK
jgi:hypothetical protein